jgi:hypothetical protein
MSRFRLSPCFFQGVHIRSRFKRKKHENVSFPPLFAHILLRAPSFSMCINLLSIAFPIFSRSGVLKFPLVNYTLGNSVKKGDVVAFRVLNIFKIITIAYYFPGGTL